VRWMVCIGDLGRKSERALHGHLDCTCNTRLLSTSGCESRSSIEV
jgi:hypothetical protein